MIDWLTVYLEAQKAFDEHYKALHLAHKLNDKWKRLLRSVPNREDYTYKQFSSKVRGHARRTHGTVKGLELDHQVPIRFMYALGFSISECNKVENIQYIKRSKNRRKGFKVDIEAFKKIYPEYSHLIE